MIEPRRAVGTVLCGVLLTLTALAFDAAPLLVPGVALLLIGTAAPVWVALCIYGVKVERRLTERHVIEDQPVHLVGEVEFGLLGLRRAAVHDPLGGTPVMLSAPAFQRRRHRRQQVRGVTSFARRGRKQLPPPALRCSDPLELSSALRRGKRRQEVLVLPRIHPVRWGEQRVGGRLPAAHGDDRAEAFAAGEIDGLRPYRAGTPASRIHWPALARGAGLLERRMHADAEERPLVALDARCAPEGVEQLDAAVRAAASLALALAREGGCALLLPDQRRPVELDAELLAWPSAHARLALIECGASPPAIRTGRRLSAVFYVAAQLPGRLPPDLWHNGALLVLPAGTPGIGSPANGFEVAGCVGFRLSPQRPRPRRPAMATYGPGARE